MIVETADFDYEQRLVDRIALKEIIRALPYRQKDVILRRYVHGETLDEVGGRHDITRERTRQVEIQALKKLKEFARRRRRPLPQPAPPPPPKPAKPVVKKPPEDKRAIFERELQALRRAIHNPYADYQVPQPQPAPTPQPSPAPFWSRPYVPPPPPLYKFAQHELEAIAAEALKQFLNIRRPAYVGTPYLGEQASGVRFPRVGGEVLRAVEALANEIPLHAQLSARRLDIPPDADGASWATPEVALRVTHHPQSDMMFFHVTWT